jgi:hypothetical protein
MEEPLQMAEAVRQACIAAALQAYEDAGLSGLCQEGRWEYAVDAMRGLHLRPLVQALHAVAPVPRCFPQGEGSPGQVLGAEENPQSGSGKAQALQQAEASGASGTVPLCPARCLQTVRPATSSPDDPDPRARW